MTLSEFESLKIGQLLSSSGDHPLQMIIIGRIDDDDVDFIGYNCIILYGGDDFNIGDKYYAMTPEFYELL